MIETLYTSCGSLRYRKKNNVYNLILEIDQDIVKFYRSLMPKYITNPQMYPAHISVIRNEIPPVIKHWGKHEGEIVNFQYSPIIHYSKIYYWLNCFSKRLEEIRTELGLSIDSEYTRPPDSYIKCFHTTIGNIKKLNQ